MATVVLSGALANKPFNGGNAWSRMSWVTGLRRLGLDVLFVEEINQANCVDSTGTPAAFDNSANLACFRSTMEQFGLANTSALICDGGKKLHGLSLAELVRRAQQGSLLFNLSGHLTQQDIKGCIGCKIYYDDDPGFTQFWHAAGDAGARLDGHDFYFTLGANIGAADCPIPTSGIAWRHTRPPVVLDDWPDVGPLTPDPSPVRWTRGTMGESARPKAFDRFTTVASWRGAYGPVQYGGKTYGLKVHEFRKFFEMPRRSGYPCEVALHIHPADQKDLDALRAHGWRVADPRQVAGTTDAFRRYVQTSGAEFSVAQGIYVDTNSGWFSDRTVRYLASGRPALVQETGFSRHLPTGEGLLSFRTMDEAAEGAHRIVRDYDRHCRAARRVAEEHFDSDKVIRQLLGEIGLKLP